MRVGLIIYGELNTISGGYLYDRQLVDYLTGRGDEVEIVSIPWLNYGRHLLHNFPSGITRQLRTASFDILLQDELNHPSLFWLNRWLRHEKEYPIISIVHHLRINEAHPSWQMALYRRVERDYLRSVDGFIFNSQTTQAAVVDLLGEKKPGIVAYPAGDHVAKPIDPGLITRRAHLNGPLRILFVGNLIPRKRLHDLLTALTLLPRDCWQLNIVGDMEVDPAYVRQVTSQIVTDKLKGRIIFHGRLAEETLVKLFKASHLLVVPSSYEGFGIVYLEGQAYGLPAIATTSGAAREIIIDDQNGYLLSPGDVAGLAQRIKDLHDDREKLGEMGLAAYQRYQQHPTWEESMAPVRDFLVSNYLESAHA